MVDRKAEEQAGCLGPILHRPQGVYGGVRGSARAAAGAVLSAEAIHHLPG